MGARVSAMLGACLVVHLHACPHSLRYTGTALWPGTCAMLEFEHCMQQQ